MNITLATLAERFQRFYFDKPEPESFRVWHENNNSFGNRYISWKSVTAKRTASDGDTVIDNARLYKETAYGSCHWRILFEGIYYGLITGAKTLAAVEECLDILRNDVPPEDDGTKVRHVNRLGGVNKLSKPVFHDWTLTEKLGKIMSTAFFADRKDMSLYSKEFVYVYDSYSGYSRSS